MGERLGQQQSSLESLSEGTGELDPRFVLWRKFCADQGLAIESLPGDLDAKAKEQWETLKESELGSASE
jgi:hypothetical protein